MKKLKKVITLICIFLLYVNSYAQINLKGPAQNLANEIRGIFPYIAVAIFVVVILSNLGRFVNDNGDWKKAAINILVFAVLLGAIQGLVAYVANMSV